MKPALVKIDVATVWLSRSARQVYDFVDGESVSEAGLLWVFNLARNLRDGKRDLRFWIPELKARAEGQARKYHQQDIQWIIAQILPVNRQTFNAGDVDQLFQIRHDTRLAYGAELPGKLIAGRNAYQMPTIGKFLERRWLGASLGKAVSA